MGVNDSSIYSGRPNDAKSIDYIRQEILKPALDHAGTVLILISKGMRESVHVNWEIDYAKRHDKNVVGVFAPGASDDDIPDAFQVLGDSLIAGEPPTVGWRGDQIIDAINGDFSGWENTNGGTGTARHTINRGGCR